MGQIGTIMVVINLNKIKNPKLAQPGNREWVFIIQKANS